MHEPEVAAGRGRRGVDEGFGGFCRFQIWQGKKELTIGTIR